MTPEMLSKMPLIVRHFWVAMLVSTVINFIYLWKHNQAAIELHPDREVGYKTYTLAAFLVSSIPFALMGAFILMGKCVATHEFFMPAQGNPYVAAWFAAMGALYLALSGWLLLGGAKDLEEYPGLFGVPRWNAKTVLWVWFVFGAFNGLVIYGFFKGFPLEGHHHLVFFIPLFAAMWVGVSYLIAAMGGWLALSKFYRFEGRFEGKKLTGKSGTFGMSNYNGCLTLGADTRGLYLAMLWIFRAGHPPLYIPWDDVTWTEKRVWFTDRVVLRFSRAPEVVVRLDKKDVLRLKTEVGTGRVFQGLA